MKKVNCEICDTLIIDGGKAIYCSDECAREGRRRYDRWYYVNKVKDNSVRNCIVCGKKFYPEGRRLMCSDECVEERKLQYIDKHNPPKIEEMACRWCGEEFISQGGKTFCSDECEEEHIKDYNNQYYLNVTKPKRQKAREERLAKEREEGLKKQAEEGQHE